MNSKPEIVFTFPACVGGVASFNYNIINHSRLIKNFYSKVILLKADEDDRPLFLDSFNADEVITFRFSYQENQYYVKKRLNQLLGNSKGALVTDNSFTIGAACMFGNPKTIFNLIHDYFYVNQQVQMGDMVDVAIAHSSFFSDAVFASNPDLFAGRSFYIPYGVQQLPAFPQKDHSLLNLVFVGRLDQGKGVKQLYSINQKLKTKNIDVNWTIIGKGPLKEELLRQWEQEPGVSFHEPASTEQVYALLREQDIFVFPTGFEGTPVSILECLANGVVTITNDLPGGIRDIITGSIGYRCPFNDLDAFTEKISTLFHDRSLLSAMQQHCYALSKSRFDIVQNADHYFEKFLQYEQFKRPVKKASLKMSRLDKAVFPNAIVKLLRKFSS